MASYSLFVKRSAAKELEAVATKDRRRLVDRIQALAVEARPPGVQKLSGAEKYRLRQGAYRILYTIDDDARAVVVVKIGHRGDVYR